MAIQDYRVGIVVAKCGLNENQLAAVIDRLAQIAKVIEGKIELYAPGYDLNDPEGSVPPEVSNLRYKEKVRICYLGVDRRERGAAEMIHYELNHKLGCDEIWCCPADGQLAGSIARVAQVWRLGQASRFAVRHKIIQPWVEAPPKADKKRGTPQPAHMNLQHKGAKRW
jgi:hypothetical protein